MSGLLARLGTWVGRHPAAVLAVWLPVVLAASFGARQLGVVARGGSGVLDDSMAQRAAAELNREFDDPWVDPLTLAIAGGRYSHDTAALDAAMGCSRKALEARTEVRAVIGLEEERRPPNDGVDGLVIALRDPDLDTEERVVPLLRAALEPCRRDFVRADPGGRYALTGRAAYTVDLNAWNKRSSDRAERRALPLTLIILVLVFGSLLAAALPLLMGVATTTVALALACALTELMPVSNLTASVITMLGLALGIDYSLLLVSRFRELAPELPRAEAIGRLLASAGPTIAWSGLIVSVALLGLLWSPLLETRSIGIGGALVASVSVLAATTLLPACLALFARRIHGRGVRRGGQPGLYGRLAACIVRRPLATITVTVALIGVMALPILAVRSGYSNDPNFFPRDMDARVGGEILSARGHANDALAVELLVHATDGLPVLDAAKLPALFEYGRQLAADRRVASVASAVNLTPTAALADYLALYRDPDAALSRYPEIARRWLNRSRDVALFHVTPARQLSLEEIQQLAAELGRRAPSGPFSIEVGGAPSYFNDFDRSLARSLPRVALVIILVTITLLFTAFRSWLIPLKAVVLNLLAVAAGFGVVVAVCQWGWGARLVGLDAPLPVIPATVPLMIFSLSFGVSMDYELFLLFRILAEFCRDGDTTRATVTGVGSTAPVVTGAALIMAVVFASFVASDVPLVKMLGLGLAATVAVDALLMRTLLLPAVMTLAGRWNWYPGTRSMRPC